MHAGNKTQDFISSRPLYFQKLVISPLMLIILIVLKRKLTNTNDDSFNLKICKSFFFVWKRNILSLALFL